MLSTGGTLTESGSERNLTSCHSMTGLRKLSRNSVMLKTSEKGKVVVLWEAAEKVCQTSSNSRAMRRRTKVVARNEWRDDWHTV